MPVLNRVLERAQGESARFRWSTTGPSSTPSRPTEKVFEPLCSYDRYHEPAAHGRSRLASPRADAVQPAQVGPQVPRVRRTRSRGCGQPHGVRPRDPTRPDRHDLRVQRGICGPPHSADPGHSVPTPTGGKRTSIGGRKPAALGSRFRHREIWYRSMLERLAELNQELKERVPELF